MFEKGKNTGIVACYQDTHRNLSEYLRKKLEGFVGLNQEVINLLITNSGMDRKTLSHEIDKIKSLFSEFIKYGISFLSMSFLILIIINFSH